MKRHTYIECDCDCEALRIEYEFDGQKDFPPELTACFFVQGGIRGRSVSWRWRLKKIWEVITKGRATSDYILLYETSKVRKLADFLSSIANQMKQDERDYKKKFPDTSNVVL